MKTLSYRPRGFSFLSEAINLAPFTLQITTNNNNNNHDNNFYNNFITYNE